MSGLLSFLLGFAVATAAALVVGGPGFRQLTKTLASRDAELSKTRAERDHAATDLKLLQLATEGREAAIKAENADLRRRMDDLADRVLGSGEPGDGGSAPR